MNEQDPLEELKRRKAATSAAPGGVRLVEDDPLEMLKRQKLEAEAAQLVERQDAPGIGSKILGTIAATGRDIPGVEAAQAGVRSVIRRQPYDEALSDIRGAEDAAPALARNAARFGGGALATAVLPGGAVLKGAQYGALTGALSSDPNSDVASRAIGAGFGAATGALAGRYVGRLGEKMAPSAGRARDAVVTRFSLRDAVRPSSRLGEASPPKAEGFMGNSMDNVLEAVKARGTEAPAAAMESRIGDIVRNASPVKQQGAPRARFDWFADRMGQRAAKEAEGVVPEGDDMGALLQQTLEHIRKGGTLSTLGRQP